MFPKEENAKDIRGDVDAETAGELGFVKGDMLRPKKMDVCSSAWSISIGDLGGPLPSSAIFVTTGSLDDRQPTQPTSAGSRLG